MGAMVATISIILLRASLGPNMLQPAWLPPSTSSYSGHPWALTCSSQHIKPRRHHTPLQPTRLGRQSCISEQSPTHFKPVGNSIRSGLPEIKIFVYNVCMGALDRSLSILFNVRIVQVAFLPNQHRIHLEKEHNPYMPSLICRTKKI